MPILAADSQGTAIFSGRREGLALYLARLVRPLWKSKLTTAGYASLDFASHQSHMSQAFRIAAICNLGQNTGYYPEKRLRSEGFLG